MLVAPVLTPEEAADKLNYLEITRTSRAQEAVELKQYFRGEQPLKYASPEWAAEHQAKYRDFSDNWCEVVANANAERINLIGFRLPESVGEKGDSGMSDAEKLLWDAWRRAGMEEGAQQGILEAVVARRSYLYVWGDDETGEPIVAFKEAGSCIIQYDPVRQMDPMYGVVTWDDLDSERQYAHLYTKTQVFQFWRTRLRLNTPGLLLSDGNVTLAGGWVFDAAASGDNHLGMVPLVEFPNRPQLGHGPLSDIAGVRAMQDAINLLWAYLFVAADYSSMPGRVVMGQSPPKIPLLDAQGNKVGEQPIDIEQLSRGRMLWLTGQNASIGQWDAAKLDVFTGVIEQAIRHVAAQTRTPPHYLSNNTGLSNLSGDAITNAEAGLVKKVWQTISYLNRPVREAFRLIALQLGEPELAEACRVGTPDWADPANRSDAQAADAMLKKKDIGYPFEYLLEEAGKSPTDISRIMDMKAEETQMNMAAGINDLISASSPPPVAPPEPTPVP